MMPDFWLLVDLGGASRQEVEREQPVSVLLIVKTTLAFGMSFSSTSFHCYVYVMLFEANVATEGQVLGSNWGRCTLSL